MDKEHITRGEAQVSANSEVWFKSIDPLEMYTVARCRNFGISENRAQSNAAFIADCFNGFNRTGKTYSELERDLKNTGEALLAVFECMLQYMPPKEVDKMKNALLKL